MLYADVALPLRIFQPYTYLVPEDLESLAQVGVRVIVSVQRQKYMGVILRLHDERPSLSRVFSLLEIVDTSPIFTAEQLQLWSWLSKYYFALPNEILYTLLPAGVRLERRSHVVLRTQAPDPFPPLSASQERLVSYLREHKAPKIELLETIDWGRSTARLLKELQALEVVDVQDFLSERVHPKRRRYIRFVRALWSKEVILDTLEALGRRTAQIRVLLSMLTLFQEKGLPFEEWLSLSLVQERSGKPSSSVFAALEESQIVEIEEHEVSRIPAGLFHQELDLRLSPLQERVYQALLVQMSGHLVTLLHGVTGSGKTELYIRCIKETLRGGGQALFLLPEIALTEYMEARIRAHFGSDVVVYHSRISESVRAELYWRMLREPSRVKLVLGVRSSLFLPFCHLGLVVVDEEHDPSYKQQNSSPRYHGRDLAIMLAQLHGAKVLLGSATPSVESYYNATHRDANGETKYGFVALGERYGNAPLPVFETINMKEAYVRKEYRGHFSDTLLRAIEETVHAGKQVILFQNRRGFAPTVECPECGWVALCPHCDHGLTYHKHARQMRCHYCGYSEPSPEVCPACHSAKVHMRGAGTQRIEEELQSFYPSFRIARLDLDSTSKKDTLHAVLSQFAEGELDILVGTQMVSKGLDFSKVSLVGILNADSFLSMPDFRAHERAFDLILQVGGRAGRRTDQGRVLIQTFSPTIELFGWVKRGDYLSLYHTELERRKRFHFPPYVREILLTLQHEREDFLLEQAHLLHQELSTQLRCEVLGPETPWMAFIAGKFQQQIRLKIKGDALWENKRALDGILRNVWAQRKLRLDVDVDPY